MRELDQALLCTRLRWVGVPLLALGALMAVSAILMVATGRPWTLIPHGLLASGLALASFGANHDSAMALAWSARGQGASLPEALGQELDAELARDRQAVLSLRASPKVAMGIPVLALGVQIWLAWRLIGG
jgi:hypothetical protein